MTRKGILLVFFLLLAVFSLSFLLLTSDLFREKQHPQVHNITVIARGKNNDTWQNIRQGAEQAATELYVDLDFIVLSNENSYEEQMYLLERESTGGSEAVILSAADSNRLVPEAQTLMDKMPIVCIESPLNTPKRAAYVTVDDMGMGTTLATAIIKDNAYKRIAILENGMSCENIVNRQKGIIQIFGAEDSVFHYPISDETKEAQEQIRALLAGGVADVFIALDTVTLEQTAQLLSDENLSSSIELYGFGGSGVVASFLEKNAIKATVVKNDFAIGYQAVQVAVSAIKKQSVSQEIFVDYRLITGETMYQMENQRLLFPFIR